MSFEAQAWAAKITLGSSSKKAVLAYLANCADQEGYCFPSIGAIQRVTELSRNTVIAAVSALEMAGLLVKTHRQRDNGSHTSNEYQLLLAVSAPKTTEKCAERAPDFVDKSVDSAGGGSAMAAPPLVQPLHPPSAMAAPLESSLNSNKPPMSPKSRGTVGSEAFEKFWAAYPTNRKFDKAGCYRKWVKRGLDAIADEVMLALRVDVASEQWRREDGRYVPHAATWLNQERYVRVQLLVKAVTDATTCHRCAKPASFTLGHHRLCMSHYFEETEDA